MSTQTKTIAENQPVAAVYVLQDLKQAVFIVSLLANLAIFVTWLAINA